MMLEGEVSVKNNFKITVVWEGRQSGVIYGEAEVASGFGEGFETNDDHA